MYKLLIAEDEDTIRKGIISTINWTAYQIEVCAEASNGEEALFLMEENKPDIVLTDIQMPKMNGLEFIQKARDKGFSFESIILTGYEDFNYAKDSIRLKVYDYILKPAQPSNLLNAVLKAKEKLEQIRFMDNQLNLIEQFTYKSIHLEKIEKLLHWLHSHENAHPVNRAQMANKLKMNIHASKPVHTGMVLFPSPQKNQIIDDEVLLRFCCINITKETLTSYYNNKIEVFFDNDSLIWIGNIGHSYEPQRLEDQLNKLVSNFKTYLKLGISIGIGEPKQSIETIQQSYSEAKSVLEGHYYHNNDNFFFYNYQNDSDVKRILHDKKLTKMENAIVTHMYNREYDFALDKLGNWLSYLENASHYHKEQVNLKAITLIIEMQKFVQGNTLTKIEWESDLINWLEKMPTMRTFEDMSTILKKIFQNVLEILTAEKPIHRTIKNAQSIIEEKYCKNLTLESVANEVFVSSAYLSFLFKQELGINFLDYLHQYRISQAKILLGRSYKIYQVAKMIGYKDERHFSSTFKKWTGITPSTFREQLN